MAHIEIMAEMPADQLRLYVSNALADSGINNILTPQAAKGLANAVSESILAAAKSDNPGHPQPYELIHANVTACEVTSEAFYEVVKWCGGGAWSTRSAIKVPTGAGGSSVAHLGYWIVRDHFGNFTVMTPNRFERTYRKA